MGASVRVRVEVERGGCFLTKSEAVELHERLEDLIQTWGWQHPKK